MVVQGIGDFPHGFELLELVGFEFDEETLIYNLPPSIDIQKIENLQTAMSTSFELYRPSIDRDLKVYRPDFQLVQTTDQAEVTTSDIRAMYASRQKQLEQMDTLVSSSFWKKDKTYKYSRVRFILPDEWRIESSFESVESLRTVASVLSEHVNDQCNDEFTFTIGNRSICPDIFDKSILELDLGQAIAMRVHFSLDRVSSLGEGFQYLKSQSIERFS
ncbi:uncharacterized protein LOC115229311 [Octopus sinensis]|uniref:Uncharacterized protein LOC115229311 n=1 Tax=Octopus sinensis TaxID=2607531 RepID=A0A6P7U1X0_9MOLL|nr:uncharacterized protein LOC115229311 [Octopus sinensis]